MISIKDVESGYKLAGKYRVGTFVSNAKEISDSILKCPCKNDSEGGSNWQKLMKTLETTNWATELWPSSLRYHIIKWQER